MKTHGVPSRNQVLNVLVLERLRWAGNPSNSAHRRWLLATLLSLALLTPVLVGSPTKFVVSVVVLLFFFTIPTARSTMNSNSFSWSFFGMLLSPFLRAAISSLP